MVPPPALTASTSTIGAYTVLPSIWPCVTSTGTPPSTNATSALVPPMSSDTRLRKPCVAQRNAADTTPAAGPDSSVWCVRPPRIAAENGMTPPFDCMR